MSLHQAYYIKKIEYRIKWLLEYLLTKEIASLSTLSPQDSQTQQTQLNIKFLQEEVARIHPANITLQESYRNSINLTAEETKTTTTTITTTTSTTMTSPPILIPTKTIMRVCDILKTEIVGVEV